MKAMSNSRTHLERIWINQLTLGRTSKLVPPLWDTVAPAIDSLLCRLHD